AGWWRRPCGRAARREQRARRGWAARGGGAAGVGLPGVGAPRVAVGRPWLALLRQRSHDVVRLLARAIQAGGPDRQAIRDYLVKVGRGRPAFDGVTGAIAFDEHGDVAGKSVTIGVVQDGQLLTEGGRGGVRGEWARGARA